MKSWTKWPLVAICILAIQAPPVSAAGLVTNLLNSLGLGELLLGSGGGSLAEIDALNPTHTGLNDLVGIDLQDPLGTLGVTALAGQLLGVETFGDALLPLDILGLGQLLEAIGLTGNGDTALLLRSLLGPDGAVIEPLVATIDGLLGTAGGAGLDISIGGLIGLSLLAGPNSGNGSLVGLSLLSGDNSGNSAQGLGIGILSGDNSGNGGLLGTAVLNGDNSGNGGLLGVAALNGDNAGNGGFGGIALLNGANAGNADTLAVAALNNDNSGNSDQGIAIGALNAGNSGQGGLIGVAVLNAPPTEEPDASCDGVACGETLVIADEDDRPDLLTPKDTAPATCADVNCTELLVAEATSCPDGDKDGVCDADDECPDTPPNTPVLANGCHLSKDRGLVLRGVNFEFDKATLTPESHVILDQATELLKAQPDVPVAIDGHTDSKGSDAYNMRLSKSRAQAVHTYFIAHGIDAKRLVFRYFGERRPIAPNTHEDGTDNPEGRALNRRTELNILDREVDQQ